MTVEPLVLPMKEAQAFWADKLIVTPQEWKTLSERARAHAFSVSGVSTRDLLEQVHAAIAEALEQGETLEGFKARIADIVEAKGWSGEKAWRVDTIFRTNIQTAYQAGRYVQMKRATATRPYWRYVSVQDRRTRPSHSALHGLVYPADHSFWSTFYPPNGFRCRCTVQALSERQVKERGYTVQTDWPGIVEPVDPKTGERLPPVRPFPDKGFVGNAVEEWFSGTILESDKRNDDKVSSKA